MIRTVLTIAREAGECILEHYERSPAFRLKADQSPVTAADEASSQLLCERLAALGFPVLSEEAEVDYSVRRTWETFWLVDPLDGTKEFLKRNGEFTVNIALVENGRPILGIVLAPATGTLWRGARGLGADKREGTGAFTPMKTRTPPSEGLTACASRSHGTFNDLDICFRNNNLTVVDRVQAGSSLKFCLIAEGKADIYPRFGPTNEWDTAAGQGVLEAAGGEVVTTDGRPLGYGKPKFSNPHFIARSKAFR